MDSWQADTPLRTELKFLDGGGELGELIRSHPWASSPLGPPSQWSQALRTAVRLILNSGHPMYVFWGPELVCLYNDAYRDSIGPERHPSSLGRPARVVWEEIWHVIGPQIDQVMAGRGATWHENDLVPITRGGRLEDVYWTYSYSPIDDVAAPHGVGGVLVVCAETTATVLGARQKDEEVVRQREMFAQAPGFMVVMSGPDHRVEFVNDAHRTLFGSDDWVGQPIRAAFPDIEGQGFFELLDGVYATGLAHRSGRVSARFRRAGDLVAETRVLDFTYAPVYSDDRQVTGVFCEGFDVTAQSENESALRDREEQLRLATEAADVGLWDLDLPSDTLYWPEQVRAMFGISPEVPISMEDFNAGLHPADRAATLRSFEAAIDPSRRSLYDVEYRTIGKEDGLVRWVAAKGRGIFDEQGRCTRVIGTAMDITLRRKTEESLRVSEERLREADRRKDEFLATLAHELRNPLAPIRSAAALLQHPKLLVTEATRYGRMIERQSKAMAVLLNDLLEVSRISTGKLQLKKEVVSVASVVDAAVEPTRPALESRALELRVQVSDGDALLEADPIRLAQVLTNLLTNAIKYSDRGLAITLRVKAEREHVTFEVEDRGIGLLQEQMSQIFQMFAQVAPSTDRSDGGLGIGLAVARSLVELHGGEISASSEGLGTGSRFTVVLPRGRFAPERAGTAPADDVRPVAPKAYPVLIVDDNVDAAEMFAALLELEGYAVRTAHDPWHALELAQEQQPVACFLDIGLPGMDGYELARRLRAGENGARLFLAATTGWGKTEDQSRALDAGFDVHMTKPIDTEKACRLLAARLQLQIAGS